jgi:RNA polymerase sigma-70 factor (ECF subfamily)
MTGNEHDAEDVAQETFLRAYRNLHRFEERAHFGSWLYRITANCAYDLLRSRARREERSVDEDEGQEDAGMAFNGPAPDRLVWSGEIRARVDGALRRMTALERAAFSLRHFEGLSIREISAALDLDASAAKHSVFRAVRKLRRALAPVATR